MQHTTQTPEPNIACLENVRLQAVRKLDAEIARFKTELAFAERTAALDSEEIRVEHEKQLAAMKLANDLLQQELAKMAESVPAMLRSDALLGALPKRCQDTHPHVILAQPKK